MKIWVWIVDSDGGEFEVSESRIDAVAHQKETQNV